MVFEQVGHLELFCEEVVLMTLTNYVRRAEERQRYPPQKIDAGMALAGSAMWLKIKNTLSSSWRVLACVLMKVCQLLWAQS